MATVVFLLGFLHDMGRPSKNNCEYFPHFTTMRNHKKIKAVRNKFGQVLGYAFWSMFIEYLTEQDGCELELSEIELEMFSGELGVSVTEIREMVDYCLKIELLFIDAKNFVYSESLNEYLKPVFEKRRTAKGLSATKKRRSNGTFTSGKTTSSGVSVTENPQSKVKEIKEKEIPPIPPERASEDFSPIIDFNHDQLKKEFINSYNWIVTIVRNNPRVGSEETVKRHMAEFCKTLADANQYPITLKEASNRFSGYLKSKLTNKMPGGFPVYIQDLNCPRID